MTHHTDTARLILFTLLWTAVWVAPLPRLAKWLELVLGLVPFAAFGLRVFAGFFVGVPATDRVRSAVGPLLDWIDDRAGFPPYDWVLDATVALGLAWLASAFDIPRRTRIATAWIMPAVAAASLASLAVTGLPVERWLASWLPAPLLAAAAGGAIAMVIRWTPSPIPVGMRRRAALVALLAVPAAATVGILALGPVRRVPAEQVAQAESIVALATGAAAAVAGLTSGGFEWLRSRWLFAMAVGVAAGAVVAMAACTSAASETFSSGTFVPPRSTHTPFSSVTITSGCPGSSFSASTTAVAASSVVTPGRKSVSSFSSAISFRAVSGVSVVIVLVSPAVPVSADAAGFAGVSAATAAAP